MRLDIAPPPFFDIRELDKQKKCIPSLTCEDCWADKYIVPFDGSFIYLILSNLSRRTQRRSINFDNKVKKFISENCSIKHINLALSQDYFRQHFADLAHLTFGLDSSTTIDKAGKYCTIIVSDRCQHHNCIKIQDLKRSDSPSFLLDNRQF